MFINTLLKDFLIILFCCNFWHGNYVPNISGLYNYNYSYLSNYRASRASGQNTVILAYGDSETAGFGGATSSLHTNDVAFSRLAQLIPLVTHSSRSSIFGTYNVVAGASVALATFDNRWVSGSFVNPAGGHAIGSPDLYVTSN